VSDEVKKPIWKRWWFWLLAVIVVIAIGTSGEDNRSTQTTSPGTQSNPAVSQGTTDNKPSSDAIKSGMYKVGVDLPAGEYVIVGSGYFEVDKDSTGSFDAILANDNFANRTIITVKDGQYFKFDRGAAYPIAKAPAVDTNSKVLKEGMYLVGKDFPAGEYKVEAEGSGYYETDKDSLHGLNSIIANDNFDGTRYVTVKAGQYLKLSNAKLYLK